MSIPPEAVWRAFDVLAAMRRCATRDELDAAMAEALGGIGLPWFSLARFFARDGTPATAVLQGRFEPGWAERYVEQNYAASSLIARELLTRSDAYSWSEVLARTGDPVQDRIFHEAREHGLRDGLFTPIRWTDHSYAAVVTAGHDAELDDPVYRTMTEVLSTYYAHECRRLGVAPPPAGTILSPRQRDCLAWVRHGKSSTDIAELLGISAQTVEEHVAEACRKLGVRTRVQAAVEASLLGII
ncbi:MAG TPA: LuxR family transcriptional regulator [Sphingomonas sp.]|nr:LuxR family transcriptional regulator [Sphingomonas sp.]